MPDLARFPPNRAGCPITGPPVSGSAALLLCGADVLSARAVLVSRHQGRAFGRDRRRRVGDRAPLSRLGRAGRFAAADVAAGDGLAVARQRAIRSGSPSLSVSTFWFILPSLPLFLALADAAAIRTSVSGRAWRSCVAGTLALYALLVLGCAAGWASSCERAPSSFFPAGSIRWSAPVIAREPGYSVIALTIDYNQRHRVELEAARTIAAQLADRHIVLPLDLRAFGGSALTERHRRAEGRRRARAFPSPTSRRATRSSSASRSAWPKRAARATSSSASTRSTIRAIPTAGRSSSPSSSGWPTSRRRRASRASGFTIHAPLQHMTKADIAREARAARARRRRSATAATIRCRDGTPLRRVRCLPAARARDSPRRGSRTRRPTHDLRRQGMLPDASGRGRAVGQPRGLPALRRLQSVVGPRDRTARARSARFCDTDFVGTDGEGGGKFASADELADHVEALWGDGSGASAWW